MTDDAADPEPQLVEGKERLFVDFDNTLTKDDVAYWDGERPEVDPIVAQEYDEGELVTLCGHCTERLLLEI